MKLDLQKYNRTIRAQRGVTLAEALVTFALAGILTHMSIPFIGGFKDSMEHMNARSIVLQDLRRAQAETIAHGCRGIVTIAAGGASYSFGCDYLSYDSSSPPHPDNTLFSRNFTSQVRVSADSTIIFNSKGQIVDEAGLIDQRVVTLSDALSTSFAQGRLSGTGLFEYE